MANLALADYLARQGHEVHLVAHRVDGDLARMPNVHVHRVPKPAGSYLLGEPLLSRAGGYWAARLAAGGGHVITNGGNCASRDANWVHYVHAAYTGPRERGAGRVKQLVRQRLGVLRERAALRRARLVIANSRRTHQDLTRLLRIEARAVHVVYYGTDPARFRPRAPDERRAARLSFRWPADAPLIAFIGALRDERKGFAVLREAWRSLCADPAWDAWLVLVGDPAGVPRPDADPAMRTIVAGFRDDVGAVLAACDGLVSPVRYEAYGLGVHEALCTGLPAIVTRDAGVAERYPEGLRPLLLDDPTAVGEVCDRLRAWRQGLERFRASAVPLAATLRAETWDTMSARIAALIEGR